MSKRPAPLSSGWLDTFPSIPTYPELLSVTALSTLHCNHQFTGISPQVNCEHLGIAIHVSFVLVCYVLNVVLGVLSVCNKCSINE